MVRDDYNKQGGKGNERSHRYSVERKTKNAPGKTSNYDESKGNKGELDETKNKEGEKPKDVEEKPVEDKQDESEKENNNEEEMEKIRLEEEKKLASDTKSTAEERINNRMDLRKKNTDAPQNRPAEGFFKQLESSMKKNTAFVKKLRSINEQQRESLISEFNGLNLSKFIQEAVTSIVEAKLKVADVSAAAYICSLFHQRYADFTSLFKRSFIKLFDVINCKEEEKAGNISRLRTALRLLGELVLDGFYTLLDEGVQILLNTIQAVVTADKNSFTYAPIILTTVRHCGEDLAGIVPRKYRCWKDKLNIDIPMLKVLTPDQQSMFLCLFKEYYENMAKYIVNMHKDLQNRERQNRQTIGLKGELPVERKEAFEKAQKVFDKLLSSTTSLAELLDEDMPDLPEDQLEEREELGTVNIFTPVRGVEYDSENGLWEDEDTRTFYENVKDLKVLVPQILFKETPTSSIQKKNQKHDKKKTKERKLRVDLNVDDSMDYNDYEELDDNYEQEILGDDGDDDEPVVVGMAAVAEAYFQKLPTCVNRDFIDQAAEEFIMKLNTKGNRKKLVRTLFTVNRVRLDLLPFYARLVSTLSPCLPDIATDLVWLLKGSFRSHLRKKDQMHTESKVKTVRFIGELTKFKVCPKAEALYCLKLLLDNFTHHNIDMACNLLETCGRFLYRSPESYPRMSTLLEQMMRKKSVQAFDSRYSTMIENAFYYCNPPERQKVQKKVRPPIHEYIRKLLYKDLTKTTTEKVLRQIRKLPWSDEKAKDYVVKCMTHVWNVKFNNIRCLANMLSGLSEYHDDVAVHVIDGVLENIRLGMETNIFRDNQRRLSSIKYLGEMYNYQLIDSDIIFQNLYLLITFGGSLEMSLSTLDPPEHLFRIRLVCTVLETCGQYFDRGTSKKKLDCFLVYFQCYIWQKKESGYWNDQLPFPRDLDYMIVDSIEGLRPKLNFYTSLEEANSAVVELNKEYEDKIKALAVVNDESESAELNNSVHSNSSLPSSPYAESPIARSPGVHSQSSQDEEEMVSGVESGNEDDEGGNELQNGEQEDMFLMENEDEVHLRETPKYVDCHEDDIFRKDFDRIMGDSITERLHDNMKIPNVDIAIPMNLKGKQKKKSNTNDTNDSNDNNSVNFVLMMKKNNKQVLRDLQIPVTSDLAANIRNKQLAERAEHEEMKRLVLDYNQRQEEESYNELMSQFRTPKRGGGGHRQQSSGNKNHRGGSRLRSRDAEQHLFSPSNRR